MGTDDIELNKIYNMPCEKGLALLPDNSVDFICTDPPYEFTNHGGAGNKPEMVRKIHKGHIDFMSKGFDISIFNEFERVCKIVNVVIFCSNKQISKIMSWWENKGYSTTLLVYKKKNPIPFANGKFLSDTEYMIFVRDENITFNAMKSNEMSKVFEYSVPTKQLHPAQKPEMLIGKLLKILTNENDLVLDCFMGSGTTAKVASILNRNFIGFEISEEYCKIAEQRLAQTTNLFTDGKADNKRI